jgi:GNAT superfamily N-acetyltransferase
MHMFSVKKMSNKDFNFAVRLTDTKGWGFVEDDFQFMMKLEPEGCFTLFENSEKIGIITSISYGRIGWFGNLIVEEKHRRKGAASQLVKHVVNYLTEKGAETVGLYSYMDAVPFYEKLSFKYDSKFTVLEGKAFKSHAECNIKKAKKEDLQTIINYDCSCLNASRRKLLEAIFHNANNLCYFSTEHKQVRGYIMAKVYNGLAEIGPLICNRECNDIAINLIRTVLNEIEGFDVTFCIPEKESTIKNFLNKSGISKRFNVARMFLKPTSIKDCIYIAESLERG